MHKKSIVLKMIRDDCAKGIRFSSAVKNAGVNLQTVVNWRNKRPMIDDYCTKIVYQREEKIVDMIEDALAKRCLSGKASPAEIIFYLCNRRSKKWKRYDKEVVVDNSKHYHYTKFNDKELIDQARKEGIDIPDSVKRRIRDESKQQPA